MKKLMVLVTGGMGFIGRNVIEQLGYKYDFVAPKHKELDLLDTTSVDRFFLRNKYFDAVIHTAIVGGNRKIPDTPEVAITNLRMFFNVAKNRRSFGRMIHLGSGIEYGREKPLVRVNETDFDKWVPQNNFGFYKYLCGKYIDSTDGIINLRLFGVFGKYEDYSIRFISNAICKSILGMPITIHQNVFFDYLYIDDFVRILDYFLTHRAKFKSYNVATDKRIDLVTIAKKINKVANYKSPIMARLKRLANEYTCSNGRLMEELASFKFSDFDDSLADLYEWYLSQKSKLRKEDFLDDHFKSGSHNPILFLTIKLGLPLTSS